MTPEQVTEQIKFKAYERAINKIQDYFEYSNQSKKDKSYVMNVIDEIAPNICRLSRFEYME